MDIAVYGGSFNPPHIGHALVASWLHWTAQVENVWLLPTYNHAFGKQMAPWDARVEWCQALAASLGPAVSVCTVESELPTPSYSIDTLNALAKQFPEHRFRLVIGSDNLLVLDKWKAWDEIAASYAPIVVGRAGYPSPVGVVVFPEISSTRIRVMLAAGDDASPWVPAVVLDKIDGSVYR
jgi:nicotinate-nucleotide adenylyltransferase